MFLGSKNKINVMMIGDDPQYQENFLKDMMNEFKMKTYEDDITIIDKENQQLYFLNILKYDYDYTRLNSLNYILVNVFLLAYGIDRQNEMERISNKWILELDHYLQNKLKFILIGMKSELRYENRMDLVPHEFASHIAQKFNAYNYQEISLKNQNPNHNPFQFLLKEILDCHLHFHRNVIKNKKENCLLF